MSSVNFFKQALFHSWMSYILTSCKIFSSLFVSASYFHRLLSVVDEQLETSLSPVFVICPCHEKMCKKIFLFLRFGYFTRIDCVLRSCESFWPDHSWFSLVQRDFFFYFCDSFLLSLSFYQLRIQNVAF